MGPEVRWNLVVLVSMLAAASALVGVPLRATGSVDAGRGPVPLVVPASLSDDRPAPLIVLLHGFGGTARGMDEYMGFSDLADRYGFVLALPDGQILEGETMGMKDPKYWNTICCDPEPEADDSNYVARLIAAIGEKHAIDARRVYLVGHSNGGFMVHRVAREHAASVAAVVSLAGADTGDPPERATGPVHVLQIHGTADAAIAYEGGEVQGLGPYPSALRTIEKWVLRNGCSNERTEVGTLDLDRALEGAETKVTRFSSECAIGGSAELWTIEGGSHVPSLSALFTPLVVEWLFAHPKP